MIQILDLSIGRNIGWWVNLKLAKIVVLAVSIAVIVYYAPSILIGFSARTLVSQLEYKPPPTATSTTEEATLRAYAENTSKTIIAQTTTTNMLKVEELGTHYQEFIYNLILSITIALIAFTIISRIYK